VHLKGDYEGQSFFLKFVDNFFGVKCVVEKSGLYASEYEDGDLLMLSKMLTGIESDEEDNNDFRDPLFSSNLESLENRDFQNLEYFNAFEFQNFKCPNPKTPEDEKSIHIEIEPRSVLQ
jgi:hypothetical protein